MHIQAIKSFQAFAELRENWDAVYDADPEAQFFLSWTWLSRWLQGAPKWFILAAKLNAEASSFVAFFPLRLRTKTTKNGEIRKEVAMAGNRGADYTGFICKPEFQHDAIAAFAKCLRQLTWDSLHLEHILASDGRTSAFLKQFLRDDYDVVSVKFVDKRDNIDNHICPYVDLPTDWETYLNFKLRPNTRHNARRYLRRVESSSEFQITLADPNTIDNDVDILLRFWAMKWGERKGKLLNGVQDTVRTMLVHCCKTNVLFMPVLWHMGKPIGVVASFIDLKNRSLLVYMQGRDESFNSPPPGFVLHAYGIRYAINNNFKTYDFLRGNEPYKFLFGAEERQIKYIVVANKRTTRSREAEVRSPAVCSSTGPELAKAAC